MKSLSLHRICCFWTMLILLPSIGYTASDPAEAERLFAAGQYAEALQIWNKMANDGQSSAGLYYNMGLAESRLQHTARAMLGFERALRLRPLDRNIRNSISEERKGIAGATVPVEPFFLSSWYKGLVTLVRPAVWAMVGLMVLMLVVFAYIGRAPFLSRKYAFILAAAGGIILGFAGLSYHEIYRKDEAIIGETCALRPAPTDDSPVTRSLSAGEKVVITDQLGEWRRVRLVNLDEGWIPVGCQFPVQIGGSSQN